jgi:hypothetical protein
VLIITGTGEPIAIAIYAIITCLFLLPYSAKEEDEICKICLIALALALTACLAFL